MLWQKLIQYEDNHDYRHGTNLGTRMLLYSIIRLNRPKRVIEVGVAEGSMTLWLAAALIDNGDDGELISVDNWSTNYGGNAKDPSGVLTKLEDMGFEDTVRVVSSDSKAFLSKQDENSAGFVWIDGDHSYDGCTRDLKEGFRVTSDLLGVHDTANRDVCPHVWPAVCDFPLEGCLIHGGRGVWLARKKTEDE